MKEGKHKERESKKDNNKKRGLTNKKKV